MLDKALYTKGCSAAGIYWISYMIYIGTIIGSILWKSRKLKNEISN